jgi:hypothetical protein
MKSHSIFPRLLVAALLAAGSLAFAMLQAQAGDGKNEKLRAYSEGVSLLNLLNGINLTQEQMKSLLALNQELKELRDSAFDGPQAKSKTVEMEAAMGDLYEYLLKHPEQEDKEIPKRAARAEHQMKSYRDGVYKQLGPEFARIAKEAEALLSSQQLAVVNDFAPCVVPPKSMRDPVRAGQAKSNEASEKALVKARELAKARKDVDAFAARVAEDVVARSEKKAKLSQEEGAALKAQALAVIKRAVKLSDTDFELQKPLLAEKLEPVNKIDELREEINKRNPHANPLQDTRNSKVARFLVNPDVVIPALEARLAFSAPGGLRDAAKSKAGLAQNQPRAPLNTWR